MSITMIGLDTAAPLAGVARLAVNAAVALGVFLWETHEASAGRLS